MEWREWNGERVVAAPPTVLGLLIVLTRGFPGVFQIADSSSVCGGIGLTMVAILGFFRNVTLVRSTGLRETIKGCLFFLFKLSCKKAIWNHSPTAER